MQNALQMLQQSTMSVEQVRRVDQIAVQQFHMHPLVLMENAGLGCTRWLTEHFRIAPHVLILCGKGNNGGDGLVIARHLQLAGWSVQVLLLGPTSSLSADACANWNSLHAAGSDGLWVWEPSAPHSIPLESLFLQADVIIDAMLGTGAAGDPAWPLNDWIQRANSVSAYRVAIDIPTGLNAETGQLGTPTFKADSTLTFVALKPAFRFDSTRDHVGNIQVIPIGIPLGLVKQLLSNFSRD